MGQNEKVRENQLRRMAERQGLALHKSRRRDPRALDYGRWTLVDIAGAAGELAESTDLDSIEAYLRGERNDAQ